MGEVNFSAEAPTQEATQAATPATTNSQTGIVKHEAARPGDYVPTADQIILPRINLVQAVGKLKDSFPPGALVLNQQQIIYRLPKRNAQDEVVEEGTPPLSITCCGFKPVRYVEQVQGGARGMICETEEEVAANNGTLDYQTWFANKDKGMKRFSPYTEGLFLIEKPEWLDTEAFGYTVDGKPHAIVQWAMKGTAYTAAAKRVFFTERLVGSLRGGYPTMQFALSTRWQKWGENGAYIPVLLLTKKSSEERIEFCNNFLEAAATATTEDSDSE